MKAESAVSYPLSASHPPSKAPVRSSITAQMFTLHHSPVASLPDDAVARDQSAVWRDYALASNVRRRL